MNFNENDFEFDCNENDYNESDFIDYPLTHNFSTDLIWNRKPWWDVTIKSVAVVPIMAVGIIGNFAIICLIVRLKSLRKSHINLFILNMAFADLFTTLMCPWIALVDNIHQNYELGPFICKLEGFIKMLCLLAGVFSLIVISLDRFIAIVYPFKKHLNRKASYVMIFLIWTLSVIMSSPLGYWRTYHSRQWLNHKEVWCSELYADISKYYWLALMVPLIYIPLFVMIVIYSIIIRRLDKYEKTISINETPARTKHRRTVIKMLYIYIITSVICWLPLQVLIYFRRWNTRTDALPFWYNNVCLIAQLFASANSAINPVITFRKTFNHLLPKLFKRKKATNRITPMDVVIIQQHLDKARPSLATDSTDKQNQLANISHSLQTNTTSFTKQIMMKRVPELFIRDEI